MQGANDLLGQSTYKLRKNDGGHFVVHKPTLDHIAKLENMILEMAYENAEKIGSVKIRTDALNRLDKRFIQDGEHKFGSKGFFEFLTSHPAEFPFMLTYCCADVECSFEEFVQACEPNSVAQAIAFSTKSFFLDLMPKQLEKMGMQSEHQAQFMGILPKIEEECQKLANLSLQAS